MRLFPKRLNQADICRGYLPRAVEQNRSRNVAEAHKPGNDGDSPYALYMANVDTMTARAHRDGARGVLEPDDVARAIVTAVTARRPKARYKVGPQARLAPLARRILGDRGWDAFMRRMVPFPAPQ